MEEIVYPPSLDKRKGGRPLTVSEVKERWEKIVEFQDLNGVLPKHIDLERLWQVSPPTVRHTLSLMSDRGMITYVGGTSASFGLTPENYRAAGGRYPMKDGLLTMTVILLAAGKTNAADTAKALMGQTGFQSGTTELIVCGHQYEEEIESMIVRAGWNKCKYTSPLASEVSEINLAVSLAQGNIIIFIPAGMVFQRDLALAIIKALHRAWWDSRPFIFPANYLDWGNEIKIGGNLEESIAGLSMQRNDFVAAGSLDGSKGIAGLFESLKAIGCIPVTLPFVTWEAI